MTMPCVFDRTINAVALVFSAAIWHGVWLFPARRVAQMGPIEALRQGWALCLVRSAQSGLCAVRQTPDLRHIRLLRLTRSHP